jgi:putative endonuclease
MGPSFRWDDEDEDMRENEPYVYILASRERGTLYIGVTSNLLKRVWEHKNDSVAGFTRSYSIHCLVWFERHHSMHAAIAREKLLRPGNAFGRSN